MMHTRTCPDCGTNWTGGGPFELPDWTCPNGHVLTPDTYAAGILERIELEATTFDRTLSGAYRLRLEGPSGVWIVTRHQHQLELAGYRQGEASPVIVVNGDPGAVLGIVRLLDEAQLEPGRS